MRRQVAAFVVGALMVPRLVSGQSLVPGARVRVAYPGEDTHIGTVVALTRDTLELRLADSSGSRRLPLDRVARLEVSRGIQPRTRYMSRGMKIGAGVGALAGLMAPCSGGEDPICVSPVGGAILGGIGGAAEGALVGLLVGAWKTEKWEWVPLEWRHMSLAAPSAGRGRGIGLRFAF